MNVLGSPAIWAAAFGLAGAVTAQAQDARADRADGLQIEEVVVTAQRREDRLQETPLAISAFSQVELQVRQITRMDDLGKAMPNVVIEPTPSATNGARVFIRGIGTDESLFTADPAVAIYVDDVYMPRIQGSLFSLYDIERVEVLRGPQGTLYGRNATNGAIRYVTRKPTGAPELTAQVNLGNFGRTDFRLSGGGGLTDTLSFQAGAMVLNNDGTTRNLTTGRDVNDSDFRAARVQLRQEFSGEASLLFSADYLADRSTPWFPVGLGRNFPAANPDGDLFTFNSTLSPPDGLNDMDQYGASLVYTGTVGGLGLTAIVSHRAYDWNFISDFDGVDAVRLHLRQFQNQNNTSVEFRLNGESDRLRWSGGVFYIEEANTQPTRQDVFAVGATNVLGQDTEAYALYWDGTFNITERFRATAGIRYSDEKKRFSAVSTLANGNPNFSVVRSDQWQTPTYRFVLDYDVAPDVMVYASYATGFKSGAFNGRGANPMAITAVDEEKVATIEGGLRSEWFDRRLRANATYYFTTYKDLQVNALSSIGVFTLVNAAEAEFQGFELELAAKPVAGLQLNATLGTLDARYTKARPGSGFNTALEPKSAPSLTWNGSATYSHRLGVGSMSYNAGVSRTGSYFQNTANSPTIKTEAVTLTNARVAYASENKAWEVAAWGRNLTDEQYVAGGLYVAALQLETAFINMPRTYGVEFTYRWGR